MAEQLDFFADTVPAAETLPAGFQFEEDVISRAQERRLIDHIVQLPFKEFEFHGHTGKRRTVSFGWSYDFTTERLQPAEPMPSFLAELQEIAAAFAGLKPGQLVQVLVTEYAEGAGIGWHRDKSVFGDVVGISLLSGCPFRLRRKRGESWQRVTVQAEPRSAYLLRGGARTEWEHSIAQVAERRYSITYRTLREDTEPRA